MGVVRLDHGAVIRLYIEGAKPSAIATELGISRKHVNTIINRSGVRRPCLCGNKAKRRWCSKECRLKFHSKHRKKYPCKNPCKKYVCTPEQLARKREYKRNLPVETKRKYIETYSKNRTKRRMELSLAVLSATLQEKLHGS